MAQDDIEILNQYRMDSNIAKLAAPELFHQLQKHPILIRYLGCHQWKLGYLNLLDHEISDQIALLEKRASCPHSEPKKIYFGRMRGEDTYIDICPECQKELTKMYTE